MIHRDKDGKLTSFAWPGGYPVIYHCADGGVLCPDCANRLNGSLASTDKSADPQWRVIDGQIFWEGPPETCDHCGAEIESAYGNPSPGPENP